MDRNALWRTLLSDRRLYGMSYPASEDSRSEFQRDYDRIVFSSSFRRLQDQTQVCPLSTNDYTRTRLTHSLECSSVGRSLGILAAKHLQRLGVTCETHDVGTIVATAALAHDLGNPPFGHSGESAIQSWARDHLPPAKCASSTRSPLQLRKRDPSSIPMTAEELSDFHIFEGNAQGFRILVRTMARTRKGGMRPTFATLGAMSKYPRPSLVNGFEFDSNNVNQKKPGYFQNDRRAANKAFRTLGLTETAPGVFVRHPLAFLTEAADDVCYAIADIEDAYKLGIVSYKEIREVMLPLAQCDPVFSEKSIPNVDASRVARMRASALQVLVTACTKAFQNHLSELESGRHLRSLIQCTDVAGLYKALKDVAKNKVYCHDRVLLVEYAGYQTIAGLLNMFHAAICHPDDAIKDRKLRQLLPVELLGNGATWRSG
ncbi:MAG: dGTP triphosphohydrolase, partial [Acidobacteriota bacterium]